MTDKIPEIERDTIVLIEGIKCMITDYQIDPPCRETVVYKDLIGNYETITVGNSTQVVKLIAVVLNE